MIGAQRIGREVGAGRYAQVTCRQCRADFHLPCEKIRYPFKLREKYFCSWKCMRQWERTHKYKTSTYLDYLA